MRKLYSAMAAAYLLSAILIPAHASEIKKDVLQENSEICLDFPEYDGSDAAAVPEEAAPCENAAQDTLTDANELPSEEEAAVNIPDEQNQAAEEVADGLFPPKEESLIPEEITEPDTASPDDTIDLTEQDEDSLIFEVGFLNSAAIQENGTASFCVSYSASGISDVCFQWQRLDDTWTDIPGETSQSLTIFGITEENWSSYVSACYRCAVTAEGVTVFSNGAGLIAPSVWPEQLWEEEETIPVDVEETVRNIYGTPEPMCTDLERQAYDILTETYGFSRASACGILANMVAESGMNPEAWGDDGTSFGLCQWHLERYDALLAFCESMQLSVTDSQAQLAFLNEELSTGFLPVRSYLDSLSDTADSAWAAANFWCVHYENPLDSEAKGEARAAGAWSFWLRYAVPVSDAAADDVAENSSGASAADVAISTDELVTVAKTAMSAGKPAAELPKFFLFP